MTTKEKLTRAVHALYTEVDVSIADDVRSIVNKLLKETDHELEDYKQKIKSHKEAVRSLNELVNGKDRDNEDSLCQVLAELRNANTV